jgi:hypothetical protein
MWDIVQQTKVGDHGVAYVVDAEGRVIAHPDFSVAKSLRDVSSLAQVQEARTTPSTGSVQMARDMNDQEVVVVYAHVAGPGWRRTLQWRSQKDWTTWERTKRLADEWLPQPRILHPWPDKRFAVRHPRWEPYARIGPVRIRGREHAATVRIGKRGRGRGSGVNDPPLLFGVPLGRWPR